MHRTAQPQGSASALKNSISSVSSGSSEEELLSVCKDFESYFVEEVLKEVKENLISDDDEDKDSSLSTRQIFTWTARRTGGR